MSSQARPGREYFPDAPCERASRPSEGEATRRVDQVDRKTSGSDVENPHAQSTYVRENALERTRRRVIEMPRFMGFVRMEEGVGTPPKALFDAMDEYLGERAAKGVFLDGGGLYGTEDAVNYVVRQGEVTVLMGRTPRPRRWSGVGRSWSIPASRRPRQTSSRSPNFTRSTGPRSRLSPLCARSRPAPRRPASNPETGLTTLA
jgi:hypothetical protein